MDYGKLLLKRIERHKKQKGWRGLIGVSEETYIHVLRKKEKGLSTWTFGFSFAIVFLHMEAIISPTLSWHTFAAYGTLILVIWCIYERRITSKLIDYLIKENETILNESIENLVADAEPGGADNSEQLKQPAASDL